MLVLKNGVPHKDGNGERSWTGSSDKRFRAEQNAGNPDNIAIKLLEIDFSLSRSMMLAPIRAENNQIFTGRIWGLHYSVLRTLFLF